MLRENAISRYLQNALGSLPSPFAQLVFLASLRDPYTGHYFHEGWASVSSTGDVNRTLRETHRTVFDSVISLSLVTLTRELRTHFESLGEAELRAAKLWLQTEPFHDMIPEGCLAAGAEVLHLAASLSFGSLDSGSELDVLGGTSLIAMPTT